MLPMEATDASKPPRKAASSSPKLFVLDNDQPRIGSVQRRAILGKFHFHHILFTGFTRKTSDELPYLVLRD
jgi:hypothetical protein